MSLYEELSLAGPTAQTQTANLTVCTHADEAAGSRRADGCVFFWSASASRALQRSLVRSHSQDRLNASSVESNLHALGKLCFAF